MKRRNANLVLIALAALGGGGVAAVLPLSFVEAVLATSGLSETVPVFAPPLGDIARPLLIGAAMIVFGGLIALFLPWGKGPRQSPGEQKESGMSFIFSRLAFFIRGRKGQPPESLEQHTDSRPSAEVPVLRRSDTHPDAPARAPLLARRDLGEEALPQSELPAAEWEDVPEDSTSAPSSEEGMKTEPVEHLPPAPEPLSWTLIEQEMNRLLGGAKLRIDGEAPYGGEGSRPLATIANSAGGAGDTGDASLPQPTIEHLLERLEQGLQRKRLKLAKHASLAHPSAEPVVSDAPASSREGAGKAANDEDTQDAPEVASPADPEAK